MPDPHNVPAPLPTQCFGLGDEHYKRVTLPGAIASTSTARLSVTECREECRADQGCGMWQAHADRGCFYGPSKGIFCEPYAGGYVGGRRKCNDKCK